MLIKVSKEVSNFIEVISHKEGDKWFYIPFWFKKIDNDVYEQVSFENLPKELIDTIKRNRERI